MKKGVIKKNRSTFLLYTVFISDGNYY